MQRSSSPSRWLFTVVLLVVFAADQGTKILALGQLRWNEPRVVVPSVLNWTLVGNTGVAFGMLQGKNTLLMLLAALLLGFGLWIARQLDWHKRETHVIGGMLVAGALGNLVDRLHRGFVVDFIDCHWGAHHWPAFNLADAAICVSVAYLVLRQAGLLRHSLWRSDA